MRGFSELMCLTYPKKIVTTHVYRAFQSQASCLLMIQDQLPNKDINIYTVTIDMNKALLWTCHLSLNVIKF